MSAWTIDSRGRGPGRRMAQAKKSERPDRNDDREREAWVGVDFGGFPATPRSRTVLPLLMLALLIALAVASLRIDLIRTRYALAETMATEQSLIEDQRALIVRKRQLHDPAVLAALAEERGFRPAESVRTMIDPIPIAGTGTPALPAVGAGPAQPDRETELAP